jgi:hypothetical protein
MFKGPPRKFHEIVAAQIDCMKSFESKKIILWKGLQMKIGKIDSWIYPTCKILLCLHQSGDFTCVKTLECAAAVTSTAVHKGADGTIVGNGRHVGRNKTE